jgi:hypothetical protein
LLRQESNYREDEARCDPTNTGIKESCVLSKISSFSVWNNVALDVMHNVFEGVADYDLMFIFMKFIEAGYFDLAKLNERILIQFLHYGQYLTEVKLT